MFLFKSLSAVIKIKKATLFKYSTIVHARSIFPFLNIRLCKTDLVLLFIHDSGFGAVLTAK